MKTAVAVENSVFFNNFYLYLLSHNGYCSPIKYLHSVRGASTSALYQRAASLAEIMKMADWSSERTFNRFYNRNVYNTNPSSLAGRLVLS